MRELVGSVTHVCDDARYRWRSNVVCTLTDEIRPRGHGNRSDVAHDAAELVWEPLAQK